MSGWLPGEKPDMSEAELKELWEKLKPILEERKRKPPIVMPTDWLAEVRDMCRKAPFRLGGDCIVRQIGKSH